MTRPQVLDKTAHAGRRDTLVQEHIGIVRDVVARVGGALPEDVDAGDLAGHGVAALIAAADEYAGRPANFGAFAKERVLRGLTGFVREQEWYRGLALPSPNQWGQTALAREVQAVCAVMAVEPVRFASPPVPAPPNSEGEMTTPGEGRGKRRAAGLAERIAALPELEQTVLGLWFQEELSLQEIAEVLGMTLGEVKVAFARGGLAVKQAYT
jgi:RNA polymerase sigma factor FliA